MPTVALPACPIRTSRCHARPIRACRSCRALATPDASVPATPCRSKPVRTAPTHACDCFPHHSRPALTSPAVPIPSKPRRPYRSLPVASKPASPIHAGPVASVPFLVRPCRTEPLQTAPVQSQPADPGHSMRNPSMPYRTLPAVPIHSVAFRPSRAFPCLPVQSSPALSIPIAACHCYEHGWNRTNDLPLRRRTLYPLSYVFTRRPHLLRTNWIFGGAISVNEIGFDVSISNSPQPSPLLDELSGRPSPMPHCVPAR